MSGTPLSQRLVGLSTAPCSQNRPAEQRVFFRGCLFHRGFLSDFSFSHQRGYLDGFATFHRCSQRDFLMRKYLPYGLL